MAAIDPSAKPIIRDSHGDAPPRATLKLIKIPSDVDDDDDDYEDIDSDDDDVDAIERRLGMGSGSESDEDEDEEKNGGPSDPAKAKKAREQAQLKELLNGVDKAEDVDMENGENAILSIVKGKGKASDDDEDESESESELEEDAQEFVICTLDPEQVSPTVCSRKIPRTCLTFYSTTSSPLTSPLERMKQSFSRSTAHTTFTSLEIMSFLTIMKETMRMKTKTTALPLSKMVWRSPMKSLKRMSLTTWRIPVSPKLTLTRKRSQS